MGKWNEQQIHSLFSVPFFTNTFTVTSTMSTAPQDSQATLPFTAQEELEFSCGQQVGSSNPSSEDSDNYDD